MAPPAHLHRGFVREGPQIAQEHSKTVQEALKTASELPSQDALRGLQEGPKKLKSLIFNRFDNAFRVLAVSGFRRFTPAQEAAKIAPRGSQEDSETAQDGPKTPEEAPKTAA